MSKKNEYRIYLEDTDFLDEDSINNAISELTESRTYYINKVKTTITKKGIKEYKRIKKALPALKYGTPFGVRRMVISQKINELNNSKKLEVVKNTKTYFKYNNNNYVEVIDENIETLQQARDALTDMSQWLVDSNDEEGKDVEE